MVNVKSKGRRRCADGAKKSRLNPASLFTGMLEAVRERLEAGDVLTAVEKQKCKDDQKPKCSKTTLKPDKAYSETDKISEEPTLKPPKNSHAL